MLMPLRIQKCQKAQGSNEVKTCLLPSTEYDIRWREWREVQFEVSKHFASSFSCQTISRPMKRTVAENEEKRIFLMTNFCLVLSLLSQVGNLINRGRKWHGVANSFSISERKWKKIISEFWSNLHYIKMVLHELQKNYMIIQSNSVITNSMGPANSVRNNRVCYNQALHLFFYKNYFSVITI